MTLDQRDSGTWRLASTMSHGSSVHFSIPSLSGSRWGEGEGYSNSVRDCAEFEFRGTVCYKAVPTQILIPPVESFVFT